MSTVYKKPLTLSGQVQYLEDTKNVTYNIITKKEAEQILLTHCYINVITPFKHRFALKNRKTGISIRDENGKHQYPRKVDFSEYYQAYTEERASYLDIFNNIMSFETVFNSVTAYTVEQYYNLDSTNNFTAFFRSLDSNAIKMANINPQAKKRVQKMRDAIARFPADLADYNSIYIFLDRLMLNDLITIFRCCDEAARSDIFKCLLTNNMTFGYSTLESFDLFLTKLAQIRNYVCHFSSLEVLVCYSDFKTKTVRHKSQMSAYRKAIAKLAGKPKNSA